MIVEVAILILIFGGTILFIFGLMKFMWNISKTGVDIMEFFGNVGRPGTSRERFSDGPKREYTARWRDDGTKEI